MSTPLPLEGIRVLTFENFGAGPFGSMYLADLGAEVIKIESRDQGGDVLIPFVSEVVTGVDLDAGRVTVELPEGLLDL